MKNEGVIFGGGHGGIRRLRTEDRRQRGISEQKSVETGQAPQDVTDRRLNTEHKGEAALSPVL
jgi:hypothetical protein